MLRTPSALDQKSHTRFRHAQERTVARATSFHHVKRARRHALRHRYHAFLRRGGNRIVRLADQIRGGDRPPRLNGKLREERAVGVRLQRGDPRRGGGGGEVVVEDVFWVGGVHDVALEQVSLSGYSMCLPFPFSGVTG
jgi:hypothetical protein